MNKKNNLLFYSIFTAIFALFNILAFVIPSAKTVTFFIAYAFTCLAFVIQIFVWITSFKRGSSLKTKFFELPLLHIGVFYFAVQLFVFIFFMALPQLPIWSTIITCSVVLICAFLVFIIGKIGKREISRIEDTVKVKVFYIKSLQTDVELLVELENDEQVKTDLIALAEKIRYSDPMSSEALKDIEKEIFQKIELLKSEVNNKSAIIKEVEILLLKRNKKSKILK